MRPTPLIRITALATALCALLAAVLIAAERPGPARTTSPTTRPASAPRHPFAADDPPPETRHQAEVRKLFDFLMSEYARLLETSKDRVSRSLFVVCMSRIGRDDATEKILSMLETERENLVRMTAWQALLARADRITPQQHRRWVNATASLIRTDAFRGALKAPAAQLLATAAPDRTTKDAWRQMFAKTDSRNPRDAEAIDALGFVLVTWRSPDLVEWMLNRVVEPADAVRADRVLRAAGSTAPSISDFHGADLRKAARESAGEHRKWWNQHKANWQEVRAVADGAWRNLKPQLLPPPQPLDKVNPLDKDWRNDLELRSPDVRSLDVGFVVDATGSMTPVLEWLQRDVAKLLHGFGTVAIEARIGLTFYRDHGDEFVALTKTLTGRVPDLLKVLAAMRAGGGGDIPEAVLEGLQSAVEKNPWSRQPKARKILILIGDAPPHEGTFRECVDLAKDAADKGFRVYTVKCSLGTDPLEIFDRIAAAGGGSSLTVSMLELIGAMTGQTYERLAAATRMAATRAAATSPATPKIDPERPTDLSSLFGEPPPAAEPPDHRPAGHRLLSRVLIDIINPQFKNRIDPMVGVLWEMLEDSPKETAHDPESGVRGLERLGL